MIQSIPIFLASDDKYAPFVATTITSIVINTKAFINFYVLDGGILDENKKKIESLKEQFPNFSVEFIDMKSSGLEKFPNLKHYSLNTFSRYFIPDMKPDLDKILYMDVDIIVKNDIAELYNQELGDYPVGAVLEDFYPVNYTYLKSIYPNFKGGSNYFNAGVLLMKLDYFRKNNMTQKFVDKTVEMKDILSCPDQDIFNIFFENNFKILDYKFNVMYDHEEFISKLGKQDAINALANPVVLHYTGDKPWKDIRAKKSIDFWEIAKITPFFEEIKKCFFSGKYSSLIKLKLSLFRYKMLSIISSERKQDKYRKKFSDTSERIEALNLLKGLIFNQ